MEIYNLCWRKDNHLRVEGNNIAIREEIDLFLYKKDASRLHRSLRQANHNLQVQSEISTKKNPDKELCVVGSQHRRKKCLEGKLEPNWEGPYRVSTNTEKGAYVSESLKGGHVPRTWNIAKLKRY